MDKTYMIKVYDPEHGEIVAEFPEYDDARVAFNSFVFEGEKKVVLVACTVLSTNDPTARTDLKSMSKEEFEKEYLCTFEPPNEEIR